MNANANDRKFFFERFQRNLNSSISTKPATAQIMIIAITNFGKYANAGANTNNNIVHIIEDNNKLIWLLAPALSLIADLLNPPPVT